MLPIKSEEYDYARMRDAMYSLAGKYPFVRLETAGKSVMGKELLSLRMGRGGEYVLMAGAFHGTERITSVLLLRFAERLCAAMASNGDVAGISARRALADRGLIILPRVNPDGCDIALLGEVGAGALAPRIKRICGGYYEKWNANARGVDINHNFNAGWYLLQKAEREAGIYGPSAGKYGGERPESEPETHAVAELCRQRNICHLLAFHSQGEEIYWSYGRNTPEKGKKMARIMAASSGYALEFPTGLAGHGGCKDWFIDRFGRPGFTVEVGKGRNPLLPHEVDAIYDRLEEMMMLACVM